MTMTGLKAFDQTLNTTHVWLRDLMTRLGTDNRDDAYRALCVTLQALRDRIPNTEAVQLGAQLPILIRGAFYESWQLKTTPVKVKTREDFMRNLRPQLSLSDAKLSDEDIVCEVFGLLKSKISEGEIDDVVSCLPPQLKELWNSAPYWGYYDAVLPTID